MNRDLRDLVASNWEEKKFSRSTLIEVKVLREFFNYLICGYPWDGFSKCEKVKVWREVGERKIFEEESECKFLRKKLNSYLLSLCFLLLFKVISVFYRTILALFFSSSLSLSLSIFLLCFGQKIFEIKLKKMWWKYWVGWLFFKLA